LGRSGVRKAKTVRWCIGLHALMDGHIMMTI
jgi:hypothetical protein